MRVIAIDSSVLYAMFDRSDREHERCTRFLAGCRVPLVTNAPVLTEVAYLLDFSERLKRDFLSWAHEALVIDEAIAGDLPRIVEVLEKYADLRPDFADAALVALCERRRVDRIATFDSDFDVYRMADGRPIENEMRSAE